MHNYWLMTSYVCLGQHNTTQHNTTQHNTTQHNTTQHNTTQHNATQRNATQHNTTQQHGMLFSINVYYVACLSVFIECLTHVTLNITGHMPGFSTVLTPRCS